jgi:chromosome segregation ATPase
VAKNESLLEIVRRRDGELKDAFARISDLDDQRKEGKRRVAELEHRLSTFAEKNKELDEIINEKLVERAERYKHQVQGILGRSEHLPTEQSISHAYGNDS